MADIVEDKDKTEKTQVAGTPEFTPISPTAPPVTEAPVTEVPPVPPVEQAQKEPKRRAARRQVDEPNTGEQVKAWLGELCKLVGEVAHQAGHPELVRRADQLSATLEAMELA